MGGPGSGNWGPRIKPYAERNRDIVDLYKGHMTLDRIAEKYGISRERVRQILNRTAPGTIAAVKQEKMAAKRCTYRCEVCGAPVEVLVSAAEGRRTCSRACMKRLELSTTGRQCYELRQQGHSWRAVHRLSNLRGRAKPVQNAFNTAKRFAERFGLPWPPCPRGKNGTGTRDIAVERPAWAAEEAD